MTVMELSDVDGRAQMGVQAFRQLVGIEISPDQAAVFYAEGLVLLQHRIRSFRRLCFPPLPEPGIGVGQDAELVRAVKDEHRNVVHIGIVKGRRRHHGSVPEENREQLHAPPRGRENAG